MNTLERLKELEAKATPGPWRSARVAESIEIRQEKFNKPRIAYLYEVGRSDAEFLVAMRNALPSLLAVVEAAEATSPFCEEPTVTAMGLVPCDVCPECLLRLSIAALEDE